MSPDDMSDKSIREVAGVVAVTHFAVFLYQAIGFGLVFVIWQISELEEPWHRGPWHFLYFGWLVIYLAFAQYSHKCRVIESASDDFESSSAPEQSKVESWWQKIQPSAPDIPWWARLPLFLLVMFTWPAILLYVALRHIHSVIVTPAKWPEAAVFIAAVLALFVVPTYGPGPFLVTAIHVGLVILLRSKAK